MKILAMMSLLILLSAPSLKAAPNAGAPAVLEHPQVLQSYNVDPLLCEIGSFYEMAAEVDFAVYRGSKIPGITDSSGERVSSPGRASQEALADLQNLKTVGLCH